MIKVYIASPYSIGNKEDNVKRQMKVADELMDLGYIPFVPLLAHYQDKLYPRPYQDWLKMDLEWLKQCDCLLRLDGKSKGADIEEALAKALKLSVFYSIDSLNDTCI